MGETISAAEYYGNDISNKRSCMQIKDAIFPPTTCNKKVLDISLGSDDLSALPSDRKVIQCKVRPPE